MINQTNASLTELNDKLLAGKAALEQSEIDDLLVNLKIELSRAVSDKDFALERESENWQKVFESLVNSELANPFMEEMEKDLFYTVG